MTPVLLCLHGNGEAEYSKNGKPGEVNMKLSAPKNVTWWVAVILGLAGLLGFLNVVAFLSGFAFWLVFVGFVLLVLGTLLKDL